VRALTQRCTACELWQRGGQHYVLAHTSTTMDLQMITKSEPDNEDYV
jgi:hypothetical protein